MKTAQNPWAPYEPDDADPWDLGKVAHLHRRGFRSDRAELERDLKAGPAASVDRLLDPPERTSADHDACDGLRAS